MSLVTRNLTNNLEGPLQYPNGTIVANGTELWFELVNSDHEPCFGIDATTGEVILSPASCITGSGIFSINLWPNDRGTTSMYRLSAPSIPEFGYLYSYIVSGTGSMTFSEFMALAETGTTWTTLPGYLLPLGGKTIIVSATAPSNPLPNDLWVDISI
jgi:hypothetical protein